MAESSRQRGWLIGLYLLLLGAGLFLFVLGVIEYGKLADLGLDTTSGTMLIGIGAMTVIITAAMFPIAWALLVRVDARGPTSPAPDLEQMYLLMRSINDRLLISDATKRITGRQQERDLIRRAIAEDMQRGDVEAALALAKELAIVHGYQQESEELREQIESARRQQYQERITRALEQLDHLLAEYQWEAASAEAAKIQRLFPDSHRVVDLHRRVKLAWEQHKQNLERQFLETAQRDDVETAMELLHELDKYLTPGEAEPFKEVARGVIGKKKENLGVQFKLAVHDRDWIGAVQVGEQIIREFPKSRMADEVRSMLDVLRERSQNQRAVSGL
jgi:hypothetical protein